MDPYEIMTNGDISKDSQFKVKLDNASFDYYPYVDTMCYCDTENDILTNYETSYSEKVLRSTDGEWYDEM